MTTIPITILDDFLDNPDAIRDFALSLEFNSEPSGRWPGKRTNCLSSLHPYFYNYINKKILSLFFENTYNCKCSLYFQLIENHTGDGWVHQDPDIFTYIIYLSPENKIDCGTSLYNLKYNKIHTVNSIEDYNNLSLRKEYHRLKSLPSHIQKIKNQDCESNFNKILNVKDRYNRLLCFSSENHHSANNLSNNDSPRLTLIGFIYDLSTYNLPIIRSKQTLML